MEFSDTLLTRLSKAKSVCVLTGAGISQESGICTFRDKGGLWDQFKPEDLATFEAFINNPELVWHWYEFRRQTVHKAKPNGAHKSLKKIEKKTRDFTLVTQNVDNLHHRAGNKNILELHGNIDRNYCIACGQNAKNPRPKSKDEPAQCSKCGGLVRPDVVWFGEMLPADMLWEAEQAAKRCEVFLSIGTSAAVYPAAGLPLIAKRNGALTVEVNSNETELTGQFDEVLRGKAGDILPILVKKAFR